MGVGIRRCRLLQIEWINRSSCIAQEVYSILLLLLVAQLLLILCNSPPGSRLPIHHISQARVLEWVVISCSRGSSRPRVEPMSSAWQADSLPLSHLRSPAIQYPVINHNRKEYEKEHIYIYITELLCCTVEINTIIYLNKINFKK